MKKYLHRIMLLILITTILLTGKNVKAATIKHSGTSGSLDWSIDSDGVFRLSGSGDYVIENEDGESETAWDSYSDEIKSAQINVTNITSFDKLFLDCKNLKSIDWKNTNTAKLISMEEMFEDCYGLVVLDFSNLDTSKVKSMYASFCNCIELQKVVGLKTSSVEDMSHMFDGCQSLKDLYLSQWNTSNVTNMSNMFSDCHDFVASDINDWDTSSVKDMSYMFSQCYALTDINISRWNTSNVLDMTGMFNNDFNGYSDNKLTTVRLNGIDVSNVTSMARMFAGCQKLTTIEFGDIDTSNVIDMSGMFSACRGLKKLDLSRWDTSNVTDMSDMFERCNMLETLDVSTWNTSKVKSMYCMFNGCASLTEIEISNFKTNQLEEIDGIFFYCSSLKKIDLSKFDLSNIKQESTDNKVELFEYNNSLTSIKFPLKLKKDILLLDKIYITDKDIISYRDSKTIKWIDDSGKVYEKIPKNLSKSIWVKRVIVDDENSNTGKKTTVVGDTMGAPSTSLKIGSDVEFTIPNDVPIIGGGKVALDFGNIPIQYEQEGNTYKLGIGVKELNNFDQNGWFSFKKFVETQDENYVKGITNLLSSKHGVASMGWNGSPKISCYGYAQGVITEKGVQSCGGQIMIQIHYKQERQFQTTIVVVPVVIKLSGEVGVDQSLAVGLDFEHGYVYGQGSTEFIIPEIRFSGGVGVAYIADVSVYGSVENKITLTSNNPGTPSVKAELSGEAGVCARALFASWEKPIVSGTIEYYNSEKKTKTVYSRAAVQNISSDLNEYMIYRDDSNWEGGVQKRTLEKGAVKTLVADVFKGTKPILLQTESGKKVLVFTADISERTTGNHTAVVYSVYDEDTGIWAEPKVIDDDGTADFKPSVAVRGEDVIVAWSNTKKIFAENEVNSDDFLKQVSTNLDIEIATIHLNDSTIECKVVTDDEYMDTNVSVTNSGDNVYITWIKNMESDVLNMSGRNCICVAQELGGWKASVINQTDQVVKTVVAGTVQDTPVVAYVMDKDGNSKTVNDAQLRIVSLNGKQIFATDNTICLNPQFSCVNGVRSMTWYTETNEESNIAYLDSTNGKVKNLLKEGKFITSDYFIVNGKTESLVLFSNGKQGENGRNIYAYQLKNGSVNDAIEITDVESYVSDPVAISTGNGYVMMFLQNRVDITADDMTESVDLSTMNLSYKGDIQIENISYETEKMQAGQQTEVAVTIKNNGLTNVSKGTIQILNGQEILATLQVEDTLEVGETREYMVPITLPTKLTETDSYVVKVMMGDGAQMDSFRPAYIDLQLEVNEADDQYEIVVKNNGNVQMNSNLVIYDKDTDGNELANYSLGLIASGDTIVKTFTKDELSQLGEALCVKAETQQKELLECNNQTYLYVGDDIVQSLDHLKATKTKVVYKAGEKLNVDDVTLYAVYEDGEESEVTEYTTNVESIDMSNVGNKKLTLTYEENYIVRTVSFDIRVEENVPNDDSKDQPNYPNVPVVPGNTDVPVSISAVNNGVEENISSSPLPKMKGIKVRAKKRGKILIQWKKIKKVSGYQIQITTNKKFKKLVKTRDVKKCKYTWKKLKKGKIYYVRVRAITYDKQWTAWSKTKKVKVK